MDGTDPRSVLPALRRHDGSEKARDLRHLADPGIAFVAFDKSQGSGEAAAALACHFAPLSGRKRVEHQSSWKIDFRMSPRRFLLFSAERALT